MSYLSDIYENPPGGNQIVLYHNRLVITAPSSSEVHNAIISRINDPETFDQVTGVAIIDPTKKFNNFGLTNAQVFRDVLYLFKFYSTYSLNDNGDEPAFWSGSIIDQSIGSRPNGIANTNVAGGESVDYLIVHGIDGIYLFTGYFHRPELTWKLGRDFTHITAISISDYIINDYRNKKIYQFFGGSDYLTLLDYKTVSPDFSNYSTEIKISEWKLGDFNGNDLEITAGTLFLNSATGETSLIIGEENSEQLLELGSHGFPLGLRETFTDDSLPFLIFPSLKDVDNKLLHVGAIRFRLTNNPIDLQQSQQLQFSIVNGNLTLPTVSFPESNSFSFEFNNNNDPTITVNNIFQNPQLLVRFNNLLNSAVASEDGGPGISKIIIFVKPIYMTLPYQYVPNP